MKIIAEIKAHCKNPERIRTILKDRKADFRGVDKQTDTYFKINNGRLKLREGSIENNLIHYQRENISGPKKSKVSLYKSSPDSSLKQLLIDANGILASVVKKREIYFIANVKFHLDEVEHLGSFVEIEAIGEADYSLLLKQCNEYLELFEIADENLIDCSYSDMILRSSHA